MEPLTAFGKLLVGALGSGHPIRLMVGFSLGFLVKTIILVWAAINPSSTTLSALNELGPWWFILIVTPLLFIPLIWRRHGAPESVVHQANTLRMLLDESGMTAGQKQTFWNMLISRFVQSVLPDLKQSPPVRELADSVIKELQE